MLFVTSPHSGEKLPKEAPWLQAIDPKTLLTDVDRFVDELYNPACQHLKIPMIKMEIHRYAIDLNRLPTDIDSETVSEIPKNYRPLKSSTKKFVSGFHWKKTTQGQILLPQPISFKEHQKIVETYYNPFHEKVRSIDDQIFKYSKRRYHLDLHSMPSQGGPSHKDNGQTRTDVVISDCEGKSCSKEFTELTISSFKKAGFSVSHNWPYLGGRLTEMYGTPTKDKHSLQIELNRKLYMDEETKQKAKNFDRLQLTLEAVFKEIIACLTH